MKSLDSKLTGVTILYNDCYSTLKTLRFTLGGGWEYDHGFFDCALEDTNQVFLRLPFATKNGKLENLQTNEELLIELGQPFVLVHKYQAGNDESAAPRVVGALVDQFQAPQDPDAPVETKWLEQAQAALRRAEQSLLAARTP